jgi:hypothetical protein
MQVIMEIIHVVQTHQEGGLISRYSNSSKEVRFHLTDTSSYNHLPKEIKSSFF